MSSPTTTRIGATLFALALGGAVLASSHREAPFITELPKVDATDFYMFTSYEPGRSEFLTLIAECFPLQDGYGGPNFFNMDPEAAYDMHVDNTGDARPDLTFRFRFTSTLRDLTLLVGAPGKLVSNAITGKTSFAKPLDNIGTKSLGDYAAYASNFIYEILLPDGSTGRLFVGQRKDPFVVNLGKVFDLVNLNPVGDPAGASDDLDAKNVTSLVLELPKSYLAPKGQTLISGYTTAKLPAVRVLKNSPTFDKPTSESPKQRRLVQISRLGNPLVNEAVIGLPDKNRFNASRPTGDGQFLDYVTHPTLPEIIQALFGVQAPDLFPREDLVAVFLTGVGGLNQDGAAIDALMFPEVFPYLNTPIPGSPHQD